MKTSAMEGAWLQTYTGGIVHPLEPKLEEIRLDDIAAALSKLCRYGGHCIRFYSVAEHCVLMAAKAPPGAELCALMHDASEAYLVDVPRPLKPHLANYRAIEGRLMRVIAARFDLCWPFPLIIEQLDTAICADERAQNMTRMDVSNELWGAIEPPLGVALRFWPPATAAHEFISAFYRYGGKP